MKRILLFMVCCALPLIGFAQEYDEFTQDMGVVSVTTDAQKIPFTGRVFIEKPLKSKMTGDEWNAYRRCMTFCLIDAGYEVANSAQNADIVLSTNWEKEETLKRKDEPIATYTIKVALKSKSNAATIPSFEARTIIAPDGGCGDALMYTCAAFLDNRLFKTPHEVNFWISLDDVEFNEVASVLMMKRLSE